MAFGDRIKRRVSNPNYNPSKAKSKGVEEGVSGGVSGVLGFGIGLGVDALVGSLGIELEPKTRTAIIGIVGTVLTAGFNGASKWFRNRRKHATIEV